MFESNDSENGWALCARSIFLRQGAALRRHYNRSSSSLKNLKIKSRLIETVCLGTQNILWFKTKKISVKLHSTLKMKSSTTAHKQATKTEHNTMKYKISWPTHFHLELPVAKFYLMVKLSSMLTYPERVWLRSSHTFALRICEQ